MTDPREQRLDPEKWPLDEVLIINSHAMLMGYLTMAIKGLGYLVLTWTTVVLLGGFVSMLHKKDFWCLTFITLVQTAGVFDAVMNEKLSYIGKAVIALLRDGYLDVLSERDPLGDTYSWLACLARFLLACILTLVQVLVLVVVLCPLAILYVLGIVMSGGISLWRLIQHDYSNSDTNGEAPNLAPALDTLYYLALLQGVLFCYRFILRRMRNRLANEVASKKYKSDCSDVEVVSNYLCETRRGCEKDQSFAKGRNLITVAVEKIGSNSLFECISGVRMLYTSINIAEKKLGCHIQDNVNYCLDSVSEQHIPMKQQDILRAQHKLKNQRNIVSGQRLLTNYLIVSASPSRHVLQKLLEMLDPRGVYNREIRNKAASILERLAFTINLEEFPRGIQHISSLIGTLQDYGIAQPYEREYDQYGWLTPSLAFCDDVIGEFEKGYKLPLLSGLLILERLAFDENNCRIMSNTRDLISKIMAPVTSDLLHRTTDDHGVWSDVVYSSMKVLAKLTRAPGETGAKLRREISSYEEAINTLWRILNCNECNEEKQLIAFIILGRLYYMDTESSISSHFIVPKNESSSYSKEVFIWKLVNIFTRDNMHSSSTRVYAGGVLSWICLRSGISDVATIVRHTSGGDVVDGLTKVLTQDEDKSCRQVAAEILENLCAHYIEDDECPGKLKKVVTDLIPEVLGKIILSADKTHTGKEVDHDSLAKQKFDIENQCDGTRENNEWGKEGKEIQAGMRPVDSTYLLSSLLSLCATVYCTMFISDLPPLVDVSSFLTKLHGVVVEKSDPTEENLLLCKATCKMVISMMKYNGSGFSKQEELENFLEVLSRASKGMLNLDHSMVFRFIDGFEYIWVKLNRCTLASLVKEAEELHATMMSTSTSG